MGHPQSPWSQMFHDTELAGEIKQDLKRTYPENEFFQRDDTQKSMLNVLFIWSKLNPEISYRQGNWPSLPLSLSHTHTHTHTHTS